jgi:hypothetical protein
MIGGCHPSDQPRLAAFERDRTQYEQLLTMARQDSQLERIADIADTWHRDQEGINHHAPERGLISAERWAEYRRLFHALDLERGVWTAVGLLNGGPKPLIWGRWATKAWESGRASSRGVADAIRGSLLTM